MHCLVCCNVIVEYDEEKGIEGDDAVFCEGSCSAWIHRKCACLSKKSYEALTEQELPYFCPHCVSINQTKEVEELKKLVASLISELNSVKLQMQELKEQHANNNFSTEAQSSSTTDNLSIGPPLTQPSQTLNLDIHSTISTILSEEREKDKRQLNLIVHQLTESTKEVPNPERLKIFMYHPN